MLDADHLAALVAANAVLRATTPEALDATVPSCPGWTVGDLIEHIAQVQRWATRVVLAPPGEKVPRRVDVPSGPAIVDNFATSADALEDALSTVDLDHDVYSFVGTRPARWWLRRQAHEAAIHAWDVQDACGTTPDPIQPAFAADGIDELFDVLLGPRLLDTAGFAPSGETFHVHTTDVDGEWLLRVAPDVFDLTRAHAKGDLALRGPAADVLLVLWGRRTVDATDAEAFGALDLLDRLRAAAPL